MIREVNGKDLMNGMRLALPMGRKATVRDVHVFREYVTFRTEHGKTRVGVWDPVLIEVDE